MGRTLVTLLLAALVLAGCSSSGTKSSRYSLTHDRYPDDPVDVSKVPDAVPRVEAQSRGGNKSPYTVLGKQYYVLGSSKGYVARGTASWYGEKFHGHLTSNGERYDMYTMTAAHKTLPLPTFAQVTNLDNGKKVIVRINDRGPFHDDRVIDLSYAAAARLEMLGKGTARVEVRAIDPLTWNQGSVVDTVAQSQPQVPLAAPTTPVPVAGRYLQVGAYSNYNSAVNVRDQMSRVANSLNVSLREVSRNGMTLYRVVIGPLNATTDLDSLSRAVQSSGLRAPILVDEP